MNREIKVPECLRYSATETQIYIVQYKKPSAMRNDFIVNMCKDLKKIQTEVITDEELRVIIKNIRKYL